MSTEERQAAESAVDALAAALPEGMAYAEENELLASQIADLPQFTRATTYGEGGSGGVIAEFSDGQPYIIVNGARADQEGVEALGGLVGASAARSGVPNGKKAMLFRSMGAAFADVRASLKTILTDAGYTATLYEGTIENLAAVRNADVFYFDTHGVYKANWGGVGKDLSVAWTSTHEPAVAYEALCAGPAPQLVRMTALDSYDGAGNAVNLHNYGITAEFLKAKGVTFATGSLVYMDSCFLDLGAFKTQCIGSGASLYAGWTDEVGGADASRAALYAFDRMAGSNSGKPTAETPKQRSFDYASVWSAIRALGWDRSGAAVLKFTAGGDDTGMLAPSIQFITLYEAPYYQTTKTKMEIAGLFGNDPGASKRKVTVGGAEVEVTEWAADMVTCDIPHFGEGSVGDVIVSVGDHKINKVPLTEWTIPFTYTMRYWGTLQDTFHVNVHIRADIHDWRDRPRQTPNKASAVLFKGMADMDGDWKSEGSGYEDNDPDRARFVWSGGAPLSGEHALHDGGVGVTAVGFVNLQSMFIEINPVAVAGQNKTQDIYSDGSHFSTTIPTWLNWVTVFDEFVDGQTYVKIPLTSGFGIAAGSREAKSNIDGSPLMEGASATLSWESAEPSYPPDPAVHASETD